MQQVSRGTAFADIDNDGDLDIAVNNSNDKPALLRNDSDSDGDWLGLLLHGNKSNRDAIGARVAVRTADRVMVREVRRNASYLSASDPRLIFGLLENEVVTQVEIRWPSGIVQVLLDAPGGKYLVIEEGIDR